MPIVEALCLHDAFDSTQCFYYDQGKTYPIDTESEIAGMTVRPLSSGKVDPKTGEIVPAIVVRQPLPVFQFDRKTALPVATPKSENDAPQKANKPAKRMFHCRSCPAEFPNLYEYRKHLKTHTEDAVTKAA